MATVFMAGCATKSSQCSRFIAVVNPALLEIQQADQIQGNKAVQLTTMADHLDRYIDAMNTIDLNDPTLTGLQSRFTQVYQQISRNSRSLVKSVQQKDASAAKKALEQMQAGTSQGSTLSSEVQKYCQTQN